MTGLVEDCIERLQEFVREWGRKHDVEFTFTNGYFSTVVWFQDYSTSFAVYGWAQEESKEYIRKELYDLVYVRPYNREPLSDRMHTESIDF